MRIEQGAAEGKILIETISGLLNRRKIKNLPSSMMRDAVLIAVDGSAASQGAARMAIRIAQYQNFFPLEAKSSDEIILATSQKNVDLLILAGYPRQSPFGWLTSSVIEQVIRNIQMPVLII